MAGVKAGDRLISIDGQKIESFEELRRLIQSSAKKTGHVTLSWESAGKTETAVITPTENKERDHNLEKTSHYTVGVVPMLALAEPTMIVERVWNPFVLAYKGTERMMVFVWRNLVSIGKMFTGNVSVATLGGPILIGKIAGDSLSRGLIAFLSTMAILSVGLGILNVLPIPVLDGGHMMLLGIEWLRGRPLSMRQTEFIQQIGLSLIILLMVVVMKNDLTRLPFFN
jgi:regulator of sigma E protease